MRHPVVRRAIKEDLDTLGRLGALLVAQHHAFDARRFLAATEATPEHYAAFLGSQLDDPDAAIFVAESDGQVVGYAFALIEGPDFVMLRGAAGIVHDLVVDPAYRGRGAGGLLLEATIADLASRGARQVVLSTAAGNEGAQRFFAREGFRRTMIEMTRDL